MRKINLKGKVVGLRPLRPSDSSRIYELVIDPEILRNTTIPTPYTLAILLRTFLRFQIV